MMAWAVELMSSGLAPVVTLAPDLMAELGERGDGVPELVAIVALPPDDLARIASVPDPLVVAIDRPAAPGNIGSLARSVDEALRQRRGGVAGRGDPLTD